MKLVCEHPERQNWWRRCGFSQRFFLKSAFIFTISCVVVSGNPALSETNTKVASHASYQEVRVTIDTHVHQKIEALKQQYKQQRDVLKQNKQEEIAQLREKIPDIFKRSSAEKILNQAYQKSLNRLQAQFNALQKEVIQLGNTLRNRAGSGLDITPQMWQKISQFDTSKLGLGHIKIPAPTDGKSRPGASGAPVGEVPSLSSASPSKGNTSTAGTVLPGMAEEIPAQEDLGEGVARAHLTRDQMLLREKAYKAELARKAQAEREAAERERSETEFLGQNNPSARGKDCHDDHRFIHPGMAEVCNYVDDNCDGLVDLDAATERPQFRLLYLDRDGDLHGDPETGAQLCPQETRDEATGAYLVPHGNDCDDLDPTRWSGC